MHDVYERMEKDGDIGPKEMKDGKLTFRAFAEYPKQITNKAGQRQRVNSLAEEMEATGPDAKKFEDDPLRAEKTKLLEQEEALVKAREEMEEMTAKMKAKLNEFNPGALDPDGNPPSKEAPKAEEAPKVAEKIELKNIKDVAAPTPIDAGAGVVSGEAKGGLLKSVK